MSIVKTLLFALLLAAAAAQAAEPTKSTMTCDDLRAKFQATPEAQERFADLKGSCMGVYEVNGALYAMTEAVVRARTPTKVTLYLPATDHTFTVEPGPDARVILNGEKVRPRDLKRGDKLSIYLSVDKFASEKQIPQIAFSTEDTSTAPLVEEPVSEPVTDTAEPAPVLPTTASPLPAMALFAGLLLLVGFGARWLRSARS